MYCLSSSFTLPIQLQLRGDIADRRAAAAAADVKRKPLGVVRVVRQKFQTLALHLAALTASDTPYLELQIYPQIAGPKISNTPDPSIVPPGLLSSTRTACRFFERRTSVTTRAYGSPNTPRKSSTGESLETDMHPAPLF
jgi:hypothetical protein